MNLVAVKCQLIEDCYLFSDFVGVNRINYSMGDE